MREWTEKHIQELIKKTGGGGGSSSGEGAQTFSVGLTALNFRNPNNPSEDITAQTLECKVLKQSGVTYQELRFYRLGSSTDNTITIWPVNVAGTPEQVNGQWEVNLSVSIPISIGFYTADTTNPQAICYGCLHFYGKFKSPEKTHGSTWVGVPSTFIYVGAGVGTQNGEWMVIQPSSDRISYLGQVNVTML